MAQTGRLRARGRASDRRPAIALGRRTAIGTAGHGFRDVAAVDLAAPVLADIAAAAAVLGRPIDDVILGNCLGPGGNVARVTALAAGLGDAVPGVTVDRQCGSGLEAVAQAATRVAAGEAEVILCGGVESASTAPWRYWPPPAQGSDPATASSRSRLARDTPGARYTRAPFTPEGWPDPDMGEAADLLAAKLGIDRRRQDEYAARSHDRTVRAQRSGVYDAEIVTVQGMSRDERPRAGLDAARLSRLRPAFGTDGTATAGNSCGVSDGAAAVAVTTTGAARAAGLEHLVVLGSAVAAGDPALPGAAPGPAVRRLLDRLSDTASGIRTGGIRIGDVGAVEITEAFASVVLAVIDDLALDEERVCAEGGAIGLGHPWGASGSILLLRLASRMLREDGAGLGVAACAIGGGQGMAMLVARPEIVPR